MLKVLLANPRGFCAGVDRAIGIVDRAIELFGKPIYVRHEVVHNRFVVNRLKQNGAVFVEELDEVPDDAIVIFSAHGVPKSVAEEARNRKLRVFDATCPLVTKVHLEVARHSKDGRECILIGHQGHPEVIGTMGQYEPVDGMAMYLVETAEDAQNLSVRDPSNLGFVTQTTLSKDDAQRVIDVLMKRFPAIQGPKSDDICYATQNRQDAVKNLADQADLVLVVGSPNSSNSNRLREIAEKFNTTAYLIDSADQIEEAWLQNINCIGISAGASAPEILVSEVVERLKSLGAARVENDEGKAEEICFPLPKELA